MAQGRLHEEKEMFRASGAVPADETTPGVPGVLSPVGYGEVT